MLKWKIVLAAYCSLVLYASSLGQPDLPKGPTVENFDKVIHFFEYALMAILAWFAFGRGSSGFAWGIFGFCSCFGIADECWQDWLDHARTPDVWDAAADAAGAFVGLLLCQVVRKY